MEEENRKKKIGMIRCRKYRKERRDRKSNMKGRYSNDITSLVSLLNNAIYKHLYEYRTPDRQKKVKSNILINKKAKKERKNNNDNKKTESQYIFEIYL